MAQATETTRSISSAEELDRKIEELERKAALQKEELKGHFSATMDSLKPVNLIKHGLQSTFASANRQDLLKAVVGIGSGILGRKLMVGRAGNRVLNRMLGAAMEFGLFGYVLNHADQLKEKGASLLAKVFRKKESRKADPSGSSDSPSDPAI